MYAGYLRVFEESNTDLSSLYFIFVSAKNASPANITDYPLVIYLLGGPGVGSIESLFQLNGPLKFKINPDGTVTEDLSDAPNFTEKYNILYIDQPIAVGNSYISDLSKIPKSTPKDVSDQFYQALQYLYILDGDCSFFKSFYTTYQKVYLSGISYAGKYIPCFANKILKEKSNPSYKQLNLKGIMIGDAFTYPMEIFSELGAHTYDLGIVDYNERMYIEQQILRMKTLTQKNTPKDWLQAEKISWNLLNYIKKSGGNVYFYDYFWHNDKIDFSLIVKFFTQYNNQTINPIKENYFVPPEINFSDYLMDVYKAFNEDFLQPVIKELEFCLSFDNFNVLVFQGRDDLIVPSRGAQKWLADLEWKGQEKFNELEFESVTDEKGLAVGYKKKYLNLEFHIINNCGHFVEASQAKNAQNMLQQFIENS